MSLSLTEANRIIAGAVAKARDMNVAISVAVCDEGGRLVAFGRMDGAFWASALGAMGKAFTSAAFALPSGEVGKRAETPLMRGVAAAEGGHMVMSQGALPVTRNGVVFGACGVGGLTDELDEICAAAGVAAFGTEAA